MEPVEALKRIAYLLERGREPTYRVRAFRRAAETIAALPPEEVTQRVLDETLTELPGIGDVTARVVLEALAGQQPAYLTKLEGIELEPLPEGTEEILGALRGDCHVHSDWSDGGSPIREMAVAARALGHEYMVLTDHSPRLTIANGLSPDRLRSQLDVVAELNEGLAAEAASGGTHPFRILTGIECDILEDGSLDQEDSLLERLDVVVASVHSKLRMARDEMTRRMAYAVANPHTDILGHCTGRIVVGRGRPESEFDAELVFAACAEFGTAVEVNSRPERLDPPRRLLLMAVEAGCLVSIDTDAHAPGQLEWQHYGAERAAACGVAPERVINTWSADDLVAWTRAR